MKQVKILPIFIAFLIAISFGNSLAMSGRFAQKMGEFGRKAAVCTQHFKQFLKTPLANKSFDKYKAFAGACEGISFAIASDPLLEIGLSNIKDAITEKYKPDSDERPASKEVADFCKKELSALGLNADKVTIHSTYDSLLFNAHASVHVNKVTISGGVNQLEDLLRKKLFLEQQQQRKLNFFDKITCGYFLSKQQIWPETPVQETVDKGLNDWRFIIQHEGGHLKNRDTLRIGIAAATIPFATYFALRRSPKTVLTSLLKIPTGYAKRALNISLFYSYKQHAEQQADDAITNDVALLEAGKHHFEQSHKKRLESIREQYIVPVEKKIKEASPTKNDMAEKFIEKWREFALTNLPQALDPSHPTPLARAQKFEERIAKLKAKEQATKKQQQG